MKPYCHLLCCMAFLPFMVKGADNFVVGSQSINYFPHYHFDSDSDKGFAWKLLEAFAESEAISFKYQSFPIKRLQRELQKGTIDFVYPDNARWHASSVDAQLQPVSKTYSLAFIVTTSGTITTRDKLGKNLSEFKSLALPFGFTPVKYKATHFDKVRKISTPDAESALRMLLMNRVDGADVEYNVMQHARLQIDPDNRLVLDLSLPHDRVAFQLSTIHHPDLISRLNTFIQNNEELIRQLRNTYNIKLPEEVGL